MARRRSKALLIPLTGILFQEKLQNLLNSYEVQLLPAEFCHFFWNIFQPGTQLWIWMLFYERRFGNNAKQNLGIMVIIIQNNTELQPEMA